jgi:phosphate transport system substrate-binding protein
MQSEEGVVNDRIKLILATLVMVSGLSLAPASLARATISIVGSSTVYPFASVVVERFGNSTDYPTPRLESTGSGGGLQLFCNGVGTDTPDITNASRRIKRSEFELCRDNGVNQIVEVLIGYDGIAIANSVKSEPMDLTLRELYLALAEQVPAPDGSEELVDNPYNRWSDINSELPDKEIEVLGPPPTSGTRDSFNELAIEAGCHTFDWLAALEEENETRYKRVCRSLREDGHFIEAGENDNLIVQKLVKSPGAFGVFGFSFLDQNRDKVQPVSLNGYEPTFESIGSRDYPVSRSMYMYIKKAHVGVVPGIPAYIKAFTDEDAWGPDGYLAERGMIPAPEKVREQQRSSGRNLEVMTGDEDI